MQFGTITRIFSSPFNTQTFHSKIVRIALEGLGILVGIHVLKRMLDGPHDMHPKFRNIEEIKQNICGQKVIHMTPSKKT